MIALPLGLCTVAAALLYRWLGAPGWSRGDRLRWALAWAPALAFGVLSCALFAVRWCGLDGVLPWILVVGAVVVALAVAVRRGRPGAPADPPTGTPAGGPPDAPGAPGGRQALVLRVASALLLAVTGVLLLESFLTWQRAQPAGMWDAVAIWNSSARFLARGQADRLPALLAAQSEGHPGYPLFLGGSVAAQWAFAGDESSAVPQGMGLAFALGLAAALHLLVRLCGAPRFAGPAVLLVFSTPIVWKWAFAQVADLPLAYLALAAALPLVAALQDRRSSGPPPVLAGLILGFLPWVKDEGVIVTAALAGGFVGLTVLGGRPWPALLRQPLSLALGMLPGLGALVLFKLSWAPALPVRVSFLRGPGKLAQLLDGERWRLVAAETLRQLDPRTGDALWGLAWPLLALGLLVWGGRLRWRTAPGAVLLLAAGTVTFAGYVLAFLLSPFDLAWHLASALDRLLMHLLPLLAAAVFSLAGAERGGAGVEPPGR